MNELFTCPNHYLPNIYGPNQKTALPHVPNVSPRMFISFKTALIPGTLYLLGNSISFYNISN